MEGKGHFRHERSATVAPSCAGAVIPFPFPCERLPRRLKQNESEIQDMMWESGTKITIKITGFSENLDRDDGMEEPDWDPLQGQYVTRILLF